MCKFLICTGAIGNSGMAEDGNRKQKWSKLDANEG